MTARSQMRREKISALVAERGEVSVEEIASLFGASHETIRRDLTTLEDAGFLLKIHGGAKRVPMLTEGSFDERMGENRAAKQSIAEKLAGWLPPDQTIFMDTGSTTLVGAEALAQTTNLRVVTNSLKIASTLSSGADGPEVFLLGGRLERGNLETLGPTTIEEINRFNADLAVITIGSLNATDGTSDYSFDEAQVARAMISRAARTVVLADHSKFDRRAAFQVCPMAEIDVLISDLAPGAALASALRAAGASVL